MWKVEVFDFWPVTGFEFRDTLDSSASSMIVRGLLMRLLLMGCCVVKMI